MSFTRSGTSAVDGGPLWHAVPIAEEQAGRDEALREIDMVRIGEKRYKATNGRGGVLPIGSGEDPDFTPVELLLAALAGCGAIDLDFLTGKRAPFASFAAHASGHKVRDEGGNHLTGLTVTFDVTFPEGEGGDAARDSLARSVQQIQDRLCTVGRTVTLGDPVQYRTGDLSGDLLEPSDDSVATRPAPAPAPAPGEDPAQP